MMVFGSRDGERYSQEHIPEDLVCTLCDPKPDAFKNKAGFMGHMAAKHQIFYELSPKGEIGERLALHSKEEPTEPQQLKPWQKYAIARHELYGETWPEVAEAMGKAPETLRLVCKTPAGQKLIEEVRALTDASHLVEMLLRDAQLNVYGDWMMAFEWAKDSRDYKFMHTMVKDVGLLPTLASMERKHDDRPQSIVINLSADTLKADEIKTVEYKVIEADIDQDD
jgi:hypothetical protein